MAQFEHLVAYGHSDYTDPRSVTIQYPLQGSGRLHPGDLSMIIVGARSEAGAAGLSSAPGYDLISQRGSTSSLQTMVLTKVADGTEPGGEITVTIPGSDVSTVSLLRFTKEHDTDRWALTEANKTQPGADDDITIDDNGVAVHPTGIIMAWKFFFPGANSFWLEQMKMNSELLGIPRLITEGSTSVSHGYRRRISISNVDGAPGVGPGEDGIPFVPDDESPPTVPGNLRLSSRTHNSASIRWDASTDDVYVNGYEVFLGSTLYGTRAAGELSALIKGLAPSSTYSFRVRAVDVAGNKSGFSNILSITTKPSPEVQGEEPEPESEPTRPERPNSIWRTGVGYHGIEIAWSGPASGPVPTRYQIIINDKHETYVGHSDRTFKITGLASGRTYHFRVKSLIDNLGGGSIARYYTTLERQEPPPPKKYTSTWTATWSDSYRSNGSPSSTGDNRLYHGYADSFNGNQRSLIGFNDASIRSSLNGARVLSVSLRIYVVHTYWNAGGKFRYGWHRYNNRPSSWSSGNVGIVGTSPTVTKGGYRTITLHNSVATRLRDGSARGVALGPAPSHSSSYYMFFAQANSGSPPKLTIEYEK